MVQNIAIVGLNRSQAYEVGKLLAEELDMHFFDCLELFEFDNIPRTFPMMLEEFGEKYYRQKEKGMLKYAAGFNECIINLECGVAESKSKLETVKSNCLLIYLHAPASKIKKKIEKVKYATKYEKKFFDVSLEKVNARIKALKEEADIVVPAIQGSALKLCSEILRKIKAYYNVQ